MQGLLIVSFIAGVLTVLAPCILPLLPVIVGRSILGQPSTHRTFVIVLALGVSVFIFTLVLKVSTIFVSAPAIFWQSLSGGLLIFFGVVTLVPSLWDHLPGIHALYVNSNKLLGSGYQKQSIWGDMVVGAALGPVFSSCSPTYFVILAAVLPVSFFTGFVYLLAYVFGLCLFLFIISYAGQKLVIRLGVALDPKSWFKKIIGVVFIVIGVAIIFGLDKKLEASLPSGTFGEIGIEQQLLSPSTTTPSQTIKNSSPVDNFLTASQKTFKYEKAPELVKPDGYINTGGQPISLSQYLGKKVVLIDFWDYSCINCQRTLPYLNAWYDKYKDKGLVIIGVHTPEFAFEHLQSNVAAAVNDFGIKYPVVLDNEYQTWNAFKNEYWPREYLIDVDGYIVHDHAGEGEYQETELAIQQALSELAARIGASSVSASTTNFASPDFAAIQSPETYFGSDRNDYLGNGKAHVAGVQDFVTPAIIDTNTLYLGGNWNVLPEYAEATSGDDITFRYNAHDVYIVAANKQGPVKIKVLRDGQLVGVFSGADINTATSEGVINGDRLYKLIHDQNAGIHTIEIKIEEGTLDAYTLTFG